jgi:ABC-type Mn2+/Zn2+ transport system ATPase subunit
MKQVSHLFSISLMLLSLCQLIPMRQVFAQDKEGQIITVKGTVTARDGSPLIGATVTGKKNAKATATDDKGHYSISVEDNAALEFNMVGFSPQTVYVNKRSVINISMTENITNLDEMVVIGYGSKKKSDLTGAVSQVSMANVETQQSISLGDYLRGSIAGLNYNAAHPPVGRPRSKFADKIR